MEFSKSRVKYGAMKMTRGTRAAVVPMRVPTMNFVSGRMNTSKMMNGTLRTTLTAVLMTP